MLTATPKRWFSWDFRLRNSMGEDIAEILFSSWSERGSIIASGTTYTIHREGRMGAFLMETPDGLPVVKAIKPAVFRREFIISHEGKQYILKAISSMRREFGLFDDNRRIGAIVPMSLFGRRTGVDFSDETPCLIQLFAVYLTLLLWRRESDDSTAAAGGA